MIVGKSVVGGLWLESSPLTCKTLEMLDKNTKNVMTKLSDMVERGKYSF